MSWDFRGSHVSSHLFFHPPPFLSSSRFYLNLDPCWLPLHALISQPIFSPLQQSPHPLPQPWWLSLSYPLWLPRLSIVFLLLFKCSNFFLNFLWICPIFPNPEFLNLVKLLLNTMSDYGEQPGKMRMTKKFSFSLFVVHEKRVKMRMMKKSCHRHIGSHRVVGCRMSGWG